VERVPLSYFARCAGSGEAHGNQHQCDGTEERGAEERGSRDPSRQPAPQPVGCGRHDESIFLYAFDLIELNADDLRRDPLEARNVTLEMILAKAGPGIRFNEHMEGDGETVFRHACKLGLEGIVSKRKDSAYRSGRSPDWLKMKNADAPAVKREEEEEWGNKKRR